MKLDAYLEEAGLTDAEFAALIGKDRSSVTRLRAGTTRPTWETAQLIARATNGAVMPNDFLPFRSEGLGDEAQAPGEAVSMASQDIAAE